MAKPLTAPSGADDDPAVLLWLAVLSDRHRDEGAGAPVGGNQRGYINVGQCVAIGDEERRRGKKRQGVSRSASGPQERHLPGIPDTHAEVGSVSDDAGERMRQVMQVEHGVGDTGGAQLLEDPCDERQPRHRHRRFGADEREGTEADGEPRRQDQRGDHSSRKTMWVRLKPYFSRCSMNRRR